AALGPRHHRLTGLPHGPDTGPLASSVA
ncbi:MAG: hypothetical protein JWM31_3288, partial [Solirubrobacterales bacterium]|nr:hypothetical protein [Solirubrobacterales bacterium]